MATVGHAYFKLLPSLQGLGREIRDQVRQSEREAPAITLAAQVQTALLREQIRAAAREGNDSAVRLLAELDAAPAETRFQRLVRELNGRSVSLKVVADKSLGSTARGLGELNDGLNRTTTQFTAMTLSVGASVLKYAALAAAVGQAVTVLGGLGSAAATASGSLLVVPAAGIAAAAAVATLKLGVEGFSDALKETDPQKYAEAIATFPPSMTAAANAARALRPELIGLRQVVQQRLFAGVAGEITVLAGTYLPLLRAELGQIAGGLNAGALGFATFAREGRTVADVRVILDNTAQSLGNASAGVRPLLQALRDIAAVGSEFLPGFGVGFAEATQRFADFIAAARESGKLREWLSAGLSAVGDLVTVVGNLAKIIGAVFSAANASGGGLLSTLVSVTDQVLAFVRSAEGAGALSQVFTGLHAIFAGLLPVLAAIGQAIVTSVAPAIAQLGPILGSAFAALAPAIAPLGQILASLAPVLGAAAQALVAVLVPALAALAPIVSALAPALTQVVGALGGALGAAITAITPALVQLAQVLAPLIEGFGGLLVQALQTAAPAVAQLVSALTPFIAQIGGALVRVLTAVMPLVSALSGIFTSVLLNALNALMPVLPVIVGTIQQLADVVGSALQVAAPVLAQVGGLLGQIAGQVLTALLPILPPLAQAFLSIVTALLPIIPPLLQIVSALLPPLLSLVTALLPVITQGAGLFAQLVTAIAPLIVQIGQMLMPVIQALFDLVKPIFEGIVAVISGAMRYISGVIDVVMGVLTGNWDRAWSGLKNMLGGIWDMIKGIVSNALKFLGNLFVELPGKLLGLLGDLGGLLIDAGKNIIRGLIKGLTAGFGWVKDKLGELTSWITSWKGPPSRDKVLLTANGRLIMGGLLAGLQDGEPQIRDYLTGLTEALPLDVSGTVTPGSAVSPAGGATASARRWPATSGPGGATGDAGNVTVVIDASGLDRHLTAWLRGAVHAQGGGNVQLAFGH
ncbi:phage tail protein [Amycolatopsis samaneae]|uniref:Phage-related protein n=1 Tax=Amycolatopsis samaneae TaxID=664691 RepID=A0ABW5GC61_9PSEU